MERFVWGVLRGLTILALSAAVVGYILGFRVVFETDEEPAPGIDLTARAGR